MELTQQIHRYAQIAQATAKFAVTKLAAVSAGLDLLGIPQQVIVSKIRSRIHWLTQNPPKMLNLKFS